MDKGVKGLLTGDLSVPLIMDIQQNIEMFQQKFERLSSQMNEIVERQETLDQVMTQNF